MFPIKKLYSTEIQLIKTDSVNNNCEIAQKDNDGKNNIDRARELLKIGKDKEAVRDLEKIISQSPKQLYAYLLIVVALQKQSNCNLNYVVSLLKRAEGIAPGNGDVHLLLGQVYSKQNDYGKAIDEFGKTKIYTRDAETLVSAYLGLLALYKKMGRVDKFNEEYSEVIKIAPWLVDVIEKIEIVQRTPSPIYGGGEGKSHPTEEQRINNLQSIRGKK